MQQSVGLFPRDEMSAFGTAGLIKLLERIMIPSYHKLLRTLRFAVTAALGPNPLEGTELNEQARSSPQRKLPPRKLPPGNFRRGNFPPGNFRLETSARKRFIAGLRAASPAFWWCGGSGSVGTLCVPQGEPINHCSQ